MQWLHPSFPEGSIIVQDKQQSPHPTRCGEVWDAGINFCKDDGFLKKKKKKVSNTGRHKAVPIAQASGWAQHQGRKSCV